MKATMKRTMWMMAMILTMTTASVAVASPNQRHQAGERGSPEVRGRVQAKIIAFITSELSTKANLDAAKTAQLQQVVEEFVQHRQSSRTARKQEMQALRELVKSSANDAALRAQMQKVAQTAVRDELDAVLTSTEKFLTAREQAALMLAVPEVMKDMRGMLREGRARKHDSVDDE
jgi:Glu-tRNA(Gln) amidotransferase subunit E-like FAD-binding protein